MPGQFCCGDKGEDGPAVGGKAYMWCVTGDWCAYVCVAFVYISLLSIDLTVTLYCILPMYGIDTWKGIAHLVFFQSAVFMVIYSHLSASWSDPGIVAKDTTGMYLVAYERELELALVREKQGDLAAVKNVKKLFCRKCVSAKPPGAHHCSLCNRCVRKMDHHCPWINNCVGERNWKAFFLFLCYVTIGTGYAMIMYMIRAHQIITSARPEDRRSGYSRNFLISIVVASIVSFILAGFFFAFVMCMFYDQYEALTTGVPGVDAMQIRGDIPKKQSCLAGLQNVVMANERFSWRWFCPIPPKTLRRSPPPRPPMLPPDSDENDKPPKADLDTWQKRFDDLALPATAKENGEKERVASEQNVDGNDEKELVEESVNEEEAAEGAADDYQVEGDKIKAE